MWFSVHSLTMSKKNLFVNGTTHLTQLWTHLLGLINRNRLVRQVIMNWYLIALKKYAVFSGRSRRKEYWYFYLFYILFIFVLSFIDVMIGTYDAVAEIGLIGGVFILFSLIPLLATSVRRLHDTDRSGWWLLIALIPIIGAIVILVFTLQDSKPGQNQYGSNPKEVAA